jgi:hypothetical protein
MIRGQLGSGVPRSFTVGTRFLAASSKAPGPGDYAAWSLHVVTHCFGYVILSPSGFRSK